MLKNTKTKKVVSAIVAVAFVFSMAGSLAHADTVTTTTTSTTSTTVTQYAFARSLTVGSTGADVEALQTFLVAKGFLVMPAGVNMGYFGSLTRAALAAFQASVGISPAVGYFGPITRAYLATHMELYGTVAAGPCPAGYTCTPANTGVTCPAGYTCTPVGGTTTSSTGEGTLTVTLGPPGGNSNIQQNVDVPVYGLQLRAQLGDVRVDRIDLDVADLVLSTPNSIENPGNFINNVKIWDGTTVLMNRNVSASDFVTGTSSTDYYLRLSGVGFMVPNGATKNLVVSFSTSGSIDTNRQLTIRGYSGTSLLYYTGNNNTTNYADISTLLAVQTFQKPGNSTVILGVDASNPLSMTNYVDANNGTQSPVTLFVFNTNTTQGSSQITQVTTGLSASGTLPTGLHLFQGATELQYQPVTGASTTVSFNNLYASNSNGGNVYSIKVDYPAGINEGSQASSTVYNVTYKNSNGNQQVVNGPITGNAQYFFSATPQLAFTSGTASVNNGTNGITVSTTGTFNFTATPYPGQAATYLTSGSDFIVVAKSGATTVTSSSTGKSVTITPQPTNGIMSAGQQYNVSLSAVFGGLPPGIWTIYVTSASSTIQNAKGVNVHMTQTWGFDNWHTNPVTVS